MSTVGEPMIFFICQLTSRQVNFFVDKLFWIRNHIYVPFQIYQYLLQNKCNVGYAFINMIDARQIISFHQVQFMNCDFSVVVSYDTISYWQKIIGLKSTTFAGIRWQKMGEV